jgi:hypothetical protein
MMSGRRATRFFKEYSGLVNAQEKDFCTLRALLDFKFNAAAIPIEEVESVLLRSSNASRPVP